LDEEKKAKEAFKNIKGLSGEQLKKSLIEYTSKCQKDLEESFKKINVGKTPLIQLDKFSSKNDLAKDFWNELLSRTKAQIKIDLNDVIIIPNKALVLQENLNKFINREKFSKEEILEIHNAYKIAFEDIIKILSPHFQKILNKEEKLDWSEINPEIHKINKKFDKLFESMNGQLRNAEGHASSYIEDNLFVWVKDDGSRDEYPPKKILQKTEDLFFLIFALSRQLNKVYLDHLILTYQQIPANLLEEAYKKIPLG
jgi:hypothetical protein